MEDTNKRSITNALHWFWQSGILEPCGRVNDCNPSDITPESIFFFSDLGVASHLHKRVSLQDTNTYGAICENFAYSCIRDMKGLTSKEPNFATFGDGELDYLFFVHSGEKLVPVGVEVKGGKTIGNTAMKLLKSGEISYLINAKVATHGGIKDNIYSVPLPLLGRFNIFDYIPDDNSLSWGKDQDFVDGIFRRANSGH